MSFYDKYFKDNVIRFSVLKMSSEEAYIAILFCAVKADDMVTREEMQALEYMISRFKGFVSFNPTHFQNVANEFLKIVDREGIDTLVNAAKNALENNLKEAVFINAVEIVMADGIVDTKEKEFLEKLQNALGIPDDRVEQIVDILKVKNRGTTADMYESNSSDKSFYT